METYTFTQAFWKKYHKQLYVIRHIEKFNNGKPVEWSDLTKLFLINLVEYFKENLSPNSARLYCAYVKSLINDYSDEVEIPCKEYNDILSLKKVGVLNAYLTNDEIKKVIEYVPKNDLEHSVRNQFVLSCLTGMRHSDVIMLDSSNINGGEIVYFAEKTETVVSTVNSPITERFISENMNEACYLAIYNDTIRNICKEVGINDIVKVVRAGERLQGEKWKFVSSHTSRRSFASNLFLHTKDIMLVSKLMGHSDISVTQGYICVDYTNNSKVVDYFKQFN